MQGGGFRTAFSAGVMDAMLMAGGMTFDHYVAVSGGSIALSYFLAGQYAFCFEAMELLAVDPNFVKMSRLMSEEGYMDIDYLEKIAKDIRPLDCRKAASCVAEKRIEFVVTSKVTGGPAYLQPTSKDWIPKVIASCTLPIVTKGRYEIGGKLYFDGGWSDPIPVKYACDQGAKHILVICTAPIDKRIKQSWPDYLASIYFRSNTALSKCFALSHEIYNDSLDFLVNPPKGIEIDVIAPEQPLLSGTYSYSESSLTQDYRHGLDLGLRYMNAKKILKKGAHSKNENNE